MIALSAKTRKEEDKVQELRKNGKVPAVLYGPGVKNVSLEVDMKDFDKVYREAGESSLIGLTVDSKKYSVLIHEIEIDPFSQNVMHVDFYQPKLDEEIEAAIPLIFEGEALAVKDLGGTLVKNIHELEVKALPQNLPHEIRVSLEKLKTFEDTITVNDLQLPENVKAVKAADEIIAMVAQPQKVEEELEKPIEENVEGVEKVEQKKEEVVPEEPETK